MKLIQLLEKTLKIFRIKTPSITEMEKPYYPNLEEFLEQGMSNRKRTSYTLDVKKGDCVGVFSQNSKDWVILMLQHKC